jgi:hypothetical protein
LGLRKALSNIMTSKNVLKQRSLKHYECHICNKSYKARGARNFHLVKKHGIKISQANRTIRVFTCGICKEIFMTGESRDYHQFYVHNMTITESGRQMKQHDCGICDRTFKSVRDVQRHRFTAHKVQRSVGKPIPTFACKLCEYIGSRKHHLAIHMRHSHPHLPDGEPAPTFSCKLCEYVGIRKHHLATHMRHSHPYSNDTNEDEKPEELDYTTTDA